MAQVTLEQVKHHLRYDDDANDDMLNMYIKAAQSAINQYITTTPPASADDDIKVATLLLVGYYDDNRTISKDTPDYGNYLPSPVRSLLWAYRKPTAI